MRRVQSNIFRIAKTLLPLRCFESLTVEQATKCRSMAPGGILRDLRDQLHSGKVAGCQWGHVDRQTGLPYDKDWYIMSTSQEVVNMMTSRRCQGISEEHFHIPYKCSGSTMCEGQTTAVTRRVMKFIAAQSILATSSSSFEDVRSEPARRSYESRRLHVPLNEGERSSWRQLDEQEKQEKQKCFAIVARLHELRGHSEMRALIEALLSEGAHPTILAAAKHYHCSACDESKPRLLRPVYTSRLDVPGQHIGIDGLNGNIPLIIVIAEVYSFGIMRQGNVSFPLERRLMQEKDWVITLVWTFPGSCRMNG